MRNAGGWFMCRVGYVETVRAVGLVAGAAAARDVVDDWHEVDVVEVDQRLVEGAVRLARAHNLRSLDALHLAAALLLPFDDIVFASWDRRLHVAARATGFDVLPHVLH